MNSSKRTSIDRVRRQQVAVADAGVEHRSRRSAQCAAEPAGVDRVEACIRAV